MEVRLSVERTPTQLRYLQEATEATLFGRMHDRGIPTWARLAEEAELDRVTMSRIKNGHVPLVEYADRLAPVLGFEGPGAGAKLVEAVYDLAWLRQWAYFAQLYHDLWAGDEYRARIQDQLSTLRYQDLYWLITLEPPLQFVGESLDDSVLAALGQGARLHYVIPSVDHAGEIEGLLDCVHHIGRVDMRPLFERFVERIRSKLPADRQAEADRLYLLEAPLPAAALFISPFVKYILVQHRQGEPAQEAWIEVRREIGGDVRRHALPLSPYAETLLLTWCRELTERFGS